MFKTTLVSNKMAHDRRGNRDQLFGPMGLRKQRNDDNDDNYPDTYPTQASNSHDQEYQVIVPSNAIPGPMNINRRPPPPSEQTKRNYSNQQTPQVQTPPSRSIKAPEPIDPNEAIEREVTEIIHKVVQPLIKYSITGSAGWQKITGYRSGTNIQPIIFIKPSVLYGLTISFAGTGLGTELSSPITICVNKVGKNTNLVAIGETNEDIKMATVIGTITFGKPITTPVTFTILPNETIKVEDINVMWNCTNEKLVRNDAVSIYCKDLRGTNMELFVN